MALAPPEANPPVAVVPRLFVIVLFVMVTNAWAPSLSSLYTPPPRTAAVLPLNVLFVIVRVAAPPPKPTL